MEFDKTKVYTSLNADESLIGAKGYFAHKATTLKNTVKRNCKSNYATVEEIDSNNEIIFNKKKWNFFYLVEPAHEKWYVAKNADGKLFGINKIIDTCELIKSFSTQKECENYIRLYNAEHSKPKYRPFKDCNELINEYCKKISRTQLNWLDCQPTELPTIWVKDKDTKYQIVSYSNCYSDDYVHIIKGNYVAMISLKELFKNYTFLDESVCGVEE